MNIKVIGIGGAGINVLNKMIASEIKDVDFISANTDSTALSRALAGCKIQLGPNTAKGNGCQAKIELGRESAEESKEEIKQALKGSDIVILIAGMGGGTGTGATPVVARISKSLGIITVGITTKPFMFEGNIRLKQAEKGIKELEPNADGLFVFENQKLWNKIKSETPASEVFRMIDDILIKIVKSIIEKVIPKPDISVAEIESILKNIQKKL